MTRETLPRVLLVDFDPRVGPGRTVDDPAHGGREEVFGNLLRGGELVAPRASAARGTDGSPGGGVDEGHRGPISETA